MNKAKQIKNLQKEINKTSDLNVFKNLQDSNSYEEFVILTTKRDYLENLNYSNSQGRGSESRVGGYLSKEMFKNAEESVFNNMSLYIEKKKRQTNVAKFFMMNTTYMNIQETEIDRKAVKASVMLSCKIIIDEILRSTNYQLIIEDDADGIATSANYIPVYTLYKKVGIAILEEQILNSVMIQQPKLAKSLSNRQTTDDLFSKFNTLARVNEGITCILKNGRDQHGNELLNVNPYDKDNDLLKIGAFFVENIINNVNIFSNKNIKEKKSQISMIGLTEEFMVKVANFENLNSMLKPRFLPKPVKFGKFEQWNSMSGGCYNFIDVDFVKNINKEMKKNIKEETYKEIYQAANNLQNTPFSINTIVFETIKELMNSDYRFRNENGDLILPYRAGTLAQELPALPAHLEEVKKDIKDFTKKRNEWYNKNSGKKKELPRRLDIKQQSKKFQSLFKEYKEHQVKVRIENEFLCANYSKYTSLMLALEQAKMMGNEAFYIPTQIDWRTRYYYLCVLNPQTSDNIKGMLNLGFSERVESEDLYFMFNCGANDYGHDKKHPDFKRDWVLENIELIAECGRNPMANIDFWGNADKPFMFLNFCTEIAQYLDNDRKYIDSKYICFFDGSCNGSQHFAGMTGDRATAVLTNLTNDTKRHDLYTVVADSTAELIKGILDGTYVEEMVIKTKFGNKTIKLKEYFKDHSAEALAFGITRKLVKQNVMTMTYGATAYGRREQVESVYKKVVNSKGNLGFEQESIGYKASLVSAIAYGAITKENPGVVLAMEWLENCIEVFSKVVLRDEEGFIVEGLSPKWYGKTGAEVTQNYRKTKVEKIAFRANLKNVQIYSTTETNKINKEANKQGIIANVTHYQDATHMTKTINECAKHFKGFVCVHDSFGCGVKNASKLFNIVRYTFAEMYDTSFLDELYTQWFYQISEYSNELAMELPRPPKRGDYEMSEGLDSIYSFI